MNCTTFLWFALLLIGANDAFILKKDHWHHYKIKYNKQYTDDEEMEREQHFLKGLDKVESHNAAHDLGLVSYRIMVNQFTDMTDEEILRMYGLRLDINEKSGSNFIVPIDADIPESIDWREHGYVTPVKNQNWCHSCWAFTATGAIEGQHFRKTGKLVSLSQQQLVDCDLKSDGCEGGHVDTAFNSIIQNGGIDTEESYPDEEIEYPNIRGKCRFNNKTIGATVTGMVVLPKGDENALKIAVATVGPIGVYLNAFDWASYSSGIFDNEKCTDKDINHGVMVVGYGSENGHDYWLLKDSGGSEYWGEDGYIRLARNKYMCGISFFSLYPLV